MRITNDIYKFYYDESQHSRRLTSKTFAADNFSFNFDAAVIGYNSNKEIIIKENYFLLEDKIKKILTLSNECELKSTIINSKKYINGFRSFNKIDIKIMNDFLDFVIENELYIFIFVYNKIEYLVNQAFKNYNNSMTIDADSLKYSISKIINNYKPQKVIDCISNNDINFINEFKIYLNELYDINKKNIVKELENKIIEDILYIIENQGYEVKIDWNYNIAFNAFKDYIYENEILDYILYIDKEGTRNTYKAANKIHKDKIIEIDSKESFGIRIADFIAGIIGSFIKSIKNSMIPVKIRDNEIYTYLNDEWFDLTEEKFLLYKKLKRVIIDQNNCINKFISGIFSDDSNYFIGLLDYFDNFENYTEYKKIKIDSNKFLLDEHVKFLFNHIYENMKNKLPVEIFNNVPEEYYNQRGALCYKDYRRHRFLIINEKETVYDVLSVGYFGNREQACVTILENNKPVCYLLNQQLMPWVLSCLELANKGVRIFPTKVMFNIFKGEYFAKFI